MMRSTVLFLWCVASCLLVPGQALGEEAPSHFEARFEQTRTTPGLERAFESQGRLRWEAGHELLWHTEQPFSHRYRLQQDRIIEVGPDGESTEILAEDAPWVVSLNEVMLALMSGDETRLGRLFRVDSKTVEEGVTQLRLLPRDQALAEQIEWIEVTQSQWPTHIRIEEVDGGRLDIRLRDHDGDVAEPPLEVDADS